MCIRDSCGDFPEDANCVLSCASKPLWEATAGCSGASEKTTHIRFPFPPCLSRKRQSWQHVFEVTTGCGDFTSLQFVFKPVCKPRTPTGRRPLREHQKDPQSGPGAPKPKTHQCCFKLILERPRLRSAPLGASLGLLGLPGRLLGPPAASWVPPVAKLRNKLVPTCSPPTADVTNNHVWSARAKHAIYEKHPSLDEKNIQVDMDLACNPDKTTFAISSLIHGPDLLNMKGQSKQRRGDLGTTVWAPSVAQHSAVRSRKRPTS